jgi:hypothetical protein
VPTRRLDDLAAALHERKTINTQLPIIGYALDTTRTTHDTSTAGDDGVFGTTVRGQYIVMITPRAATEFAIAIEVFFIDWCFFALDGGDRRRGQSKGRIIVHRGVAEAKGRALGRDGRSDVAGGGRRARECRGRREGGGAGVRCTGTGADCARRGGAS